MLKRFIAFLLLIATLCSMLVFPVNAAAPTIKASSEKYPTTLTKGSSFGIRGVYTTSAGKITSVNASLTYPNGSTNYGLFSAAPNTTSFDVNGTKGSNGKTLNSTLSFGSLSTGSHTLCITIVAQSGTEKTTYTVSKSFTVVSSSTTATITASSENYPTTLTQGSSFGIRGVYKASSGTITKVQATVKNSAGTTKFSFTANPNTQSFDVNATKGTTDKTLNGTIAFGSLAAGSYTLEIKIYANGASSPTKTVTKSFAIVSSSTTATITASSENYPTTLTQGSSFGLRGVYKASSGTITKVQATVKNSAGTTKYSFTANPNTQSFDVNATQGTTGITLNSTVAFGSLAADSYTLEIKLYANGASSPTKTVTKPFTIVSSTGSSSGGSSSGSSGSSIMTVNNLKSLPKKALDCFLKKMENSEGATFPFGLNSDGVYCYSFKCDCNGQWYTITEAAFLSESGRTVDTFNNYNDAFTFASALSTPFSQSGTWPSTYAIGKSSDVEITMIGIMRIDHKVKMVTAPAKIGIEGIVNVALTLRYDEQQHTLKVYDINNSHLSVKPRYKIKTTDFEKTGFSHFYAEAIGIEASDSISFKDSINLAYGTFELVNGIRTLVKTASQPLSAWLKLALKADSLIYNYIKADGKNNSAYYKVTNMLGESIAREDTTPMQYACEFDITSPVGLRCKGNHFTFHLCLIDQNEQAGNRAYLTGSVSATHDAYPVF
ncbi:MAG: hypothetical protein IKW50_04185 [Oscillospiraceae bacterium]|nr:hypothetical protein [Oscillospiraceae bacterium]